MLSSVILIIKNIIIYTNFCSSVIVFVIIIVVFISQFVNRICVRVVIAWPLLINSIVACLRRMWEDRCRPGVLCVCNFSFYALHQLWNLWPKWVSNSLLHKVCNHRYTNILGNKEGMRRTRCTGSANMAHPLHVQLRRGWQVIVNHMLHVNRLETFGSNVGGD